MHGATGNLLRKQFPCVDFFSNFCIQDLLRKRLLRSLFPFLWFLFGGNLKNSKNLKKYLRAAITTFATVLAVGAFMVSSTPAVFAASSREALSQQTIPGQLAPALKNITPLHATASNKVLNLSIGLNLRNVDELNALIAAQNNPTSSLYHQYLTPQQFEQSFAPTEATVQAVTSYLKSQSLQVTSVAANRLVIDANGSVANVEHAFNVSIADYTLPGRTVYSPTVDPSVPATLNGVIATIAGLDDVAQYRHYAQLEQVTGPRVGSGPVGG
jgi:subtilase family serine protease